MRVIITCAGNGTRWNNYTGVRKHLLRIDGERLVDRQVRQLRERGITDIYVFCRPDAVYDVPGAIVVTAQPHDMRDGSESVSRLATRPYWSTLDRTLFLLGDVWITDASMDQIVAVPQAWTHYARLSASKVTGKPGPEMFGAQFWPHEHQRYADALDTAGSWDHWAVYCCYVGMPVVGAHDIRDWGHHCEIADDGTDDFDFPDDYERWLKMFKHRGPRRVTADAWDAQWFNDRRIDMNLEKQKHRKVWELTSIAQAFRDRVAHRRGGPLCLGFGVGRERLPAWLAAQGAVVVATDNFEQGPWLSRQYAAHKTEMPHEGIVSDDLWRDNVLYERVDMRNIPKHLLGASDFTWSTSSMEHLGGRAQGIDFFCKQMACLRTGGIAAHVTEVALGSHTIDDEHLCMFTTGDLQTLEQRLAAQGDRLWPIDLTPGTRPEDSVIDEEPFSNGVDRPHLNLKLGPVVFTSVLLIAVKGGKR